TILGNVLAEQEGPELLASVERIRKRARSARRRGTVADIGELGAAEDGALVLRAFSLYFQLANLAEQVHRLRRRREDARHGTIARESLADAFGRLGDADLERARGASIRLVLTAHPTEATRRTVLLAHIRIAEELYRMHEERLVPDERREAEDRIAE